MSDTAFNCEDTFILGGGIPGLYAGLHLVRQGQRVTIFEKEDTPGGAYRARRKGENAFALRSLFLNANSPLLRPEFEVLLGENFVEFEPTVRFAWNGHSLSVPASFREFAASLPFNQRCRFWGGVVRSNFASQGPANAERLYQLRYGKPVSETVFQPYLTRFWGGNPAGYAPALAACEELLLDFSSLRAALCRFGLGSRRPPEPLSPTPSMAFWSRKGPEGIPHALADAFKSEGGRLVYGADITQIVLQGKRVEGIIVRDNFSAGEAMTHRLPCRHLISTLPLRSLVKAIHKGAPAQIHASSLYLTHRPLTAFAILVNRERVLDALHTHYRDRSFSCITEPKHAGQEIHPESQTLLIVEMVDAVTPESQEEHWKVILRDLEELGLVRRQDVVEFQLVSSSSGPPVFRLEYPEHRERVLKFIAGFENLHCAGGTATFRHLPPTESILDARRIADHILQRDPSAPAA